MLKHPLSYALPALMAAAFLAQTRPATAAIIPADRVTVWNPGIPGGVPVRTTICASVNASTYGNGTQDATAGIQAAINACPAGQVVQLSAGDFLVNGANPITIDKGIVLRGAGPAATKLRKTSSQDNPLILIGRRWLEEAGSANLTVNAPKGATSVQVTSAAGFSVGQVVLVDKLTDDSFVYWGVDPAVAPGGPGRGWFTRYNRPVGQMLEIAGISGNTVSFTTPLHIAFDTAHTAQLTRWTIPYGAKYAGVEDLYVRGGRDDNITLRLAVYSWVRNVESDYSQGDSIGLDSSFRCVIRDSYVHDTSDPYPGGGGYLLSFSKYTADSLVENNIFMNGNKVMVMRASGGGNVIGYNYFDNGYIENYTGWVETGLNASHLTCPHFELFEGNQAFNADGDDTWGGAVYITMFRNHLTSKRRSYPDLDNRRAIGLMWGHYYYSFVGNVLGTANQDPTPYSGFTYEDFLPWGDEPVPMWRLGYTPTDWNAPAEARVVNTVHRHANFDYVTNSVKWVAGYDQTLPASLYLAAKPAFFGSLAWPWVDATGATKLHALPARVRFDAGTPNSIPIFDLTVTTGGTGSGTVTSSPAGINCGSTCTGSFSGGTVVTLTAAPAVGSFFTGWSGACSGTVTCLVSMDADKSASASFGPASTPPPPGDFDRDGKPDLLWRHSVLGSLYVWLLNGTATTSGAYLNPSNFGDANWQIRGLADLNRDGTPDLLWHNQKTGDLYVWLMNGTTAAAGTYLSPSRFSDTSWQIRGLADLSGDGKTDILWHHQKTGDLYVWLMDGTTAAGGAYLTPSRFADTNWKIRGLADFNGDGRADLLWHNQSTGDLYVWMMSWTVTAGGAYLSPKTFAATTWEIARVADFSGDGKVDLLWRNKFDGSLYVWFMNGTVATGGSYLTPSAMPDTKWTIEPR